MTTKTTNKDFLKSHSSGFGGSDAHMFYRVGLNGLLALTTTDKKRIAVALGQIEREESFTTEAMQAGNDFEAHWIDKYTRFKNNARLDGAQMRNFNIFAHADFWDGATAIELKYSQASTEEVTATYQSQLQWYYMLGAKSVMLRHGWGAVPFDAGNYETNVLMIERNDDYIKILEHGIKLIDDFCDDFIHEDTTTDLSAFAVWDRKLIKTVAEKNKIAKELDKEIKELKAKLYELMMQKNIDKIVNDDFTATLVRPSFSRSTNWKKAFEDLGINEADYQEKKDKKGYVLLK